MRGNRFTGVCLLGILASLLGGCGLFESESPSVVSLRKSNDGHRWIIDGKVAPPAKGVVYQPTDGLKHISEHYYKQRALPSLYAQILTATDAKEIDRTFDGKGHGEEMLRAGVNAIRVYHLPVEDSKEVSLIKEIFRRAHRRYGIRVLVGDWIGLYEQPNADASNERRLERLIDTYADEPWVLAWQVGNENNYYVRGGRLGSWIDKSASEYYAFMDRLAATVKAAEARKRGKHPVVLGQGDLADTELPEIVRLRNFDAIGLNLFTSPQRIQSLLAKLKTDAPLSVLFSEIGAPADPLDDEQQKKQAEVVYEQLLVWRNNLAGYGRSQTTVAAFIYEWSDEVWRGPETGDAREGQFGIYQKQAFARLLTTTEQFSPFLPKTDAPEDLLEVVFAYIDARRYWDAIRFAQRLIDRYEVVALRQQAERNRDPRRFEPDELWALNAVGTAYFLQGRAYYEWGDRARAQTAFDKLAGSFPSATLRDKSGNRWPLKASVRRLFPEMVAPYFQVTWKNALIFVAITLVIVLCRQCAHLIRTFLTRGRRRPATPSSLSVKIEPLLTGSDRLQYVILHSAVMLAFLLFLAWWFHPVRAEMYFVSPILFWMLSFAGLSHVLFHLYLWCILSSMVRPVFTQAQDRLKVATVTTFVRGEPLEMVKDTLRAMGKVRYPHDTYVLDEANDSDLREFCERNGIKHFSRKDVSRYNQPEGNFQTRTKGGNINSWIDACGKPYEFVAFFDPDHRPVPEYLDRSLGYFADPQVAFVQPPQIYHNQPENWIARGGAERSYYFYGPVQSGLAGLDAPVLIGSHNTIRMRALQRIGGYKVHNADDLLTSLHLHAHGWRGIYIPEVLASGVTPNNWSEFFQQQFRWAHSVMDVMHHHFPRLLGKLKFRQTFGYAILYFYYLNSFTFVLLLLLPLISSVCNLAIVNVQLITFVERFFPLLALFYTLMLAWGRKFLIRPRQEAGIWHRGGMLWVACWPYLAWAFLRSIWPSKTPPRITTSKGQSIASSALSMFKPHLAYLALVVMAGAANVRHAGEFWFSKGMLVFLCLAFVCHGALILSSTSWFMRWRMQGRAAGASKMPLDNRIAQTRSS